jgi:uncharacterized protein
MRWKLSILKWFERLKNFKHIMPIKIAIALMTPAVLTSSDWMVNKLGKSWRYLHLLSVPVLVLASIHTIAIGSNYLGAMAWAPKNWILTILCGAISVGTLLIRSWRFRK